MVAVHCEIDSQYVMYIGILLFNLTHIGDMGCHCNLSAIFCLDDRVSDPAELPGISGCDRLQSLAFPLFQGHGP